MQAANQAEVACWVLQLHTSLPDLRGLSLAPRPHVRPSPGQRAPAQHGCKSQRGRLKQHRWCTEVRVGLGGGERTCGTGLGVTFWHGQPLEKVELLLGVQKQVPFCAA